MTDFNHAAHIDESLAAPHMRQGYVSQLHTIDGDLPPARPARTRGHLHRAAVGVVHHVLFPIFGGSKLAVNNEILLPAPMYWNEEERFMGGDDQGRALGREGCRGRVARRGPRAAGTARTTGAASSGTGSWPRNNATQLAQAEAGGEAADNFGLPSPSYGLRAQRDGRLGEWVGQWANVSFVDLMCADKVEIGTCGYTSPFFSVGSGVAMSEQFRYKFLPDIDATASAAATWASCAATSLPIQGHHSGTSGTTACLVAVEAL